MLGSLSRFEQCSGVVFGETMLIAIIFVISVERCFTFKPEECNPKIGHCPIKESIMQFTKLQPTLIV